MGKPDDGSAIFHNPAGMTLQEGTHLYYFQLAFLMDLGLRLYDSQGTLHPTDRELAPDYNFGGLPYLSVQTDFGTKKLRGGLAIYAPNAFGTVLPDDEPTRYHATKVLFLSSRATAALAWELNEHVSVGASVHLLFTYMTASRVLNPLVLIDPDRRFDPVDVTAPYDHDLTLDGKGFAWAWDVGLLLTPLETLHFGFSFSSGAMTTLRGDVSLRAPDGTLTTTRQTTDVPRPFTLRGGFNWEFAPDFEVGMDIFWWHYQVFQEQWSRLDEPILGLTEFRDPRHYSNSWDWCIGLLHRVVPSLEVMAGFQMDFTPIPAKTYSLDNPTTDQIGVSLGTRWQISRKVRLGLTLYRNWFNRIDVQESQGTPPGNAKAHGAVTSLGVDVNWLL
jgi:long-subunit fatty acid transport protein